MGRRAGLKVNVGRLVGLRDKLGWSQERLATEAGLATRVVWKAENDEGIDAKSLKKLVAVTEKHGLSYDQLAEEEIVIVLPNNVASMSEAEQARKYREIYDRSAAAGEVRVMRDGRGSYTVTVRVSLDDAERLKAAYRAGKLADLSVLDVYDARDWWWRGPRARRVASTACSSAAVACPFSMLLSVYAPAFYALGVVLALAAAALARQRLTLTLAACGLLLNAAALAAWPTAVGVFQTPNGVEFRIAAHNRAAAVVAPATSRAEMCKLVFNYVGDEAEDPIAVLDLVVLGSSGRRQFELYRPTQKDRDEVTRRTRELGELLIEYKAAVKAGRGNEVEVEERLEALARQPFNFAGGNDRGSNRYYEMQQGPQHISLQLGGDVIFDADVVVPDRDRVLCALARSAGKKVTVRFVPDIIVKGDRPTGPAPTR